MRDRFLELGVIASRPFLSQIKYKVEPPAFDACHFTVGQCISGQRPTLAEALSLLFPTVSFAKSSARVRNGTRLLTRNEGSLRAERWAIVNVKSGAGSVRRAGAGKGALTCKTFHPCLRREGIVALGKYKYQSLRVKSRLWLK